MARPHVRVNRKHQRAALKPKVARRISATRCLPEDAPKVREGGPEDEYIPVSDGMYRRCERWPDRSRLADEIALRLRGHTAPPSGLSDRALLMGMVLTLYITSKYQRIDVCAVLCGLTAEQAFRIGLCHPKDGYVRFSYEMVQTQIKRIEDALRDGWEVPDDESAEGVA